MKKVLIVLLATNSLTASAALNYDVIPYNGKYACENGVTASLSGTVKGIRTLTYTIKTKKSLGSIGNWSDYLFEVKYKASGSFDIVYESSFAPSAEFYVNGEFQESLSQFNHSNLKPYIQVHQYGRTFSLITPSALPTVITGRRANGAIVSAKLVPNSLTWSNKLATGNCSLIENNGGKHADICNESDDIKYAYAEKYTSILSKLVGQNGIVSLSPKTSGAGNCPLIEIGIRNNTYLYSAAEAINSELLKQDMKTFNVESSGLMTKIVVVGGLQ